MSLRRSGRLNPHCISNQNSNQVTQQTNQNLLEEPPQEAQDKFQVKGETEPQDCQQHRYFNSPQIKELIKDMKESNEQKMEIDENVQGSESPKNVSASTKALDAVEPDKKRYKKTKTPTAFKRRRLNQQLAKLLMPKSALILLHELKPGCQYKVQSQSGCIPPCFSALVEYENVILGMGQGLSKAQAKNAAAENAIKAIVSETMSKSLARVARAQAGDGGETVEEEDGDTPENLPWAGLASFAIYKMFTEWQSQGADLLSVARPVPKPKPKVPVVSNTPKRELPPNALELHPAVVLNLMHTGLVAVEIEREDGPNCRVKMGYSIDGKMFTGIGRNKKDAKKEAAKAVLEGLYGLTYPANCNSTVEQGSEKAGEESK